jgi:hypothetical protein
LMAPCTLQNAAFTVTGAGGSFPMTLKGGVTAVAAEIVVSPKVLPARLSQLAAAAPPALKDRADNAATVLTEAKSARRFVRPNFASIMAHSHLNLSFARP